MSRKYHSQTFTGSIGIRDSFGTNEAVHIDDKTQRVTTTMQNPLDVVLFSIDLTPTQGEVGNIIRRLIHTDELSAFECMEVEMARAFLACQTL